MEINYYDFAKYYKENSKIIYRDVIEFNETIDELNYTNIIADQIISKHCNSLIRIECFLLSEVIADVDVMIILAVEIFMLNGHLIASIDLIKYIDNDNIEPLLDTPTIVSCGYDEDSIKKFSDELVELISDYLNDSVSYIRMVTSEPIALSIKSL